MRTQFFLSFFILAGILHAQNLELPYHQIPEAPIEYNPGNLVARMIDGLGYRYYWATEGLAQKDLTYKPSVEGRTALATIQHIYGLSLTILNAPKASPNGRPMDFTQYSFEDLREKTLINLKLASELCSNKNQEDFEKFKVVFQRNGKQSEFPYWNMLNGPLADAIYHTGQIVLLRRASGNPVHSGMNVFMGKTSE